MREEEEEDKGRGKEQEENVEELALFKQNFQKSNLISRGLMRLARRRKCQSCPLALQLCLELEVFDGMMPFEYWTLDSV